MDTAVAGIGLPAGPADPGTLNRAPRARRGGGQGRGVVSGRTGRLRQRGARRDAVADDGTASVTGDVLGVDAVVDDGSPHGMSFRPDRYEDVCTGTYVPSS